MSKYNLEAEADGVDVTAKFDDITKFPKVMAAIVSLQPEPVQTIGVSEPEPVFLDAVGKEFGLDSVLAFKMPAGELYLIYVHTTIFHRPTNKWEITVKRLTGPDDECGNYVNLSGEGGVPTPQLFKLEATFQECIEKELI